MRLRRFSPGPYLLLAPAVAALLAISAYPLFYGIRASLEKYRYGLAQGYTGLNNFRDIWADQDFRDAMVLTAKFVVIAVSIETLLGLGLALLVAREIRFAGPIRLALILPMTIAPVVVGIVWRLIYASDIGVVNPLFAHLGLSQPDVLAHGTTAFAGLVAVDVWEWTPLLFLILLAGLQSLPQEPFEAARVDGAGRLRTFLDHTLPLLAPVLLVAVVLRSIDCVGTFDQIYVLTQGGPGTSTQLIGIYGYNTAFRFTEYGYAAAMMIALLACVLVLALVAVRLTRRTIARTAQ